MGNQEITMLPNNGDIEQWDEGQRAIADAAGLVFTHNYGPKQGQREPASRATVEKFLHVARKTGLDPLTRQLYCIGRLSGGRVEWSIQTSIDGFRVVAERSKLYAGQDPAQWMTESGEWVDVFVKQIHGKHPLAARIAVHRSDWPDRPAVAVATWDEYVQTKRDGTPTSMWEKMGPLMLAKCAEALALRRAFPQDLSGLYTSDEMSQATVSDEQPRQIAPQATGDALSKDDNIVDAEIVTDEPTRETSAQSASETPIESTPPQATRDWRADADAAPTADDVLKLFNDCRDAGELGQLTEVANEKTGETEQMQMRVYLRKLGENLRQIEEQGDVDSGAPAVLDDSTATESE